MSSLDHRLQHWVVEHRVSALNDVFVWLSRVGAWGWIFLVVALVAAVVLRRPEILLLVVVADLVAIGVESGLKDAIGRPRPHAAPGAPQPLIGVPSNSAFPSGHATVAFACATMLALLVPRLAVPMLVLAAAIAFSRVYVGVHYPLDVVAGATLGALIAIALRRLAGGLRRSRRSPKPG